MIPVVPAPEPNEFDDMVGTPGRNALLELTGDPAARTRRGPKRKQTSASVGQILGRELPDFWTRALPDLRRAYRHICAYLGMRIHEATGLATVDHFKPKSKYQNLAYDWSNFRLASHQVNTNKGEHEDVVDPFEVQEGWLVMDIGTFKVVPGEGLAPSERKLVEATIKRLDLNEPTFCAARQEYHDRYHGIQASAGDPEEPWPFSWLHAESPFVAYELTRQRRLRTVDVIAHEDGGMSE